MELDKEKLKKIRDKISKQIGDSEIELKDVKILLSDPATAKAISDSFNEKLTETNTALTLLEKTVKDLKVKEFIKTDATIESLLEQKKALEDIGRLLTEINSNTAKEIPPTVDRTDELIEAIEKNKTIVDEVDIRGLDMALEKVKASPAEVPLNATMKIERDLWTQVAIKYPTKTITVNIDRTLNDVIRKLTFS